MYSILYVDDDEDLLRLNKIFMEKSGEFQVDTVSSAPEALDRIPAIRYDAILSDYQMPDMDGIEFLKQVRTRHGNLPFILFTGRGREDVVIEAVNHGVDYYIQKGSDLKAMMAELRHKTLRAIERRQIESELKRSQEVMADIINFLPDATCVIDNDGKVIAWNHAMEQLTGVPRDEIIGEGDFAYAVPFYGERRPVLVDFLLHDLPGIADRYPGFEKTGGKLNAGQYFPALHGGTGAHVWLSASLLYDSTGRVTGGIETVRDMTEMYRMKHDLSISRDMVLGFANMMPVAIYEMNLNAVLTFANKVAFSWFGVTKEDFDRKICIADYIAPEDRERAMADIGRIARGETGIGQEYLLVRKDGGTFYGLIYAGTVTDPDTAKVTGLRGVIIDQTRRRAEAQAYHESQERLKLALRAGNIGIWDIDIRSMLIHDIHDWASRTLGFPVDKYPEISVECFRKLCHPLDLTRIIDVFTEHISGRAPHFEGDIRLRHNNGSWVRVAVRGKVIEHDKSGKPVRVTGTVNTVPGPGVS